MFKIPAWEDDGSKTGSTFLRKAKRKEKTEKKTKSTDIHVTENNKSVNIVTVNGVINEASRKRQFENILSMKTKHSSIKIYMPTGSIISNTKKKKDENEVTIPETQNFDEIILNAKKKKFNEVIENDDKEDLLFSENTQKKEKKKKAKVKSNSVSINSKSTKDVPKHNNKNKKKTNEDNKSNSEVNGVVEAVNKKARDLLFSENTQKKEKKKKAKVKSNSVSINSKSTKDLATLNNKNKKKANEDNNKSNSEVNGVIEAVNNKKARLKSLLEIKSPKSHRTPINVSKTGSKLRDRMLERLKAAQFRYLNEKLYTSSGSEAQQLFQSDPSAFETYHQGYQLQVKKWPVNPLDVIVKKIMKMPKTHAIADLGCGEAALSRRVPHKVRSFDLVATAPGVEACDMARTPLLTASMDVTVYCLALMGTDLMQYLVEANRVLKMGGHLLIAEVESRFDKVEDFTKEVERLGFKLKQLDKSNNVFFFMEFTKIRDPPVKKAKLPTLTLKPCLYKRR